jgi:hypothetical protein
MSKIQKNEHVQRTAGVVRYFVRALPMANAATAVSALCALSFLCAFGVQAEPVTKPVPNSTANAPSSQSAEAARAEAARMAYAARLLSSGSTTSNNPATNPVTNPAAAPAGMPSMSAKDRQTFMEFLASKKTAVDLKNTTPASPVPFALAGIDLEAKNVPKKAKTITDSVVVLGFFGNKNNTIAHIRVGNVERYAVVGDRLDEMSVVESITSTALTLSLCDKKNKCTLKTLGMGL